MQGMGERNLPRENSMDDEEDDDMGMRGGYGQRDGSDGMGQRRRRRSDGRYI